MNFKVGIIILYFGPLSPRTATLYFDAGSVVYN